MVREEEDEANGLSFLFHNNFTKVYLECSKVLFQIRAVAQASKQAYWSKQNEEIVSKW